MTDDTTSLVKTTIIGPLLNYALSKVDETKGSSELIHVATRMSGEVVSQHEVLLPIVIKLETQKPQKDESWQHYKERIQDHLSPVGKIVRDVMGREPQFLITANSIKVMATSEQIRVLEDNDRIQKMELDPLLQVVSMDDVIKDIELDSYIQKHNGGNGSGVNVAVLDSGVDVSHPFLNVHQSVSTCGESVNLPGRHGTHCAGIIASQDVFYRGVAPGANLLNIKVLQADGRGGHTNITRGVDAALDLGAEVLSMSLGFNHLPAWSFKGHGWECLQGHCPLCTSVDNAVAFDNVIAVVAAGNEHDKAENLRANGFANKFDTEINCPGQARQVITVGAITKQTFLPASFSSQGPTAFGSKKPDLCAPGVNITSTVPAPRDMHGNLVPNPDRISLFSRESGTSMATPIVAGVVALIIQKFKQNGTAITPDTVKNELFHNGLLSVTGHSDQIVGGGRISLRNI